MMGHNSGNQSRLFYSFNLEDHVQSNHLLRGIDHFLDLADLRAYIAPFYSRTGRPSIDPELMIRMLIVGYCFGIRSERRLCEEVHLNLAYRWFCRLGLEDAVPEHSTFSKNRHGRFRVERRFAIKPTRLIGDMAYGATGILGWVVNDKAIEPHVPVWDETQRVDETLSSSDFRWDEQTDEYRCPQGRSLRRQWRPFKTPRTHVTKADTIIYRSSQAECATCAMKTRCCPNIGARNAMNHFQDGGLSPMSFVVVSVIDKEGKQTLYRPL